MNNESVVIVAARRTPIGAFQGSLGGVAATELVSRRDGAGVEERDGRLHGLALMVLDSPDAHCFLVPVDEGRSLALVDAHAEGLAQTGLRTIDRTRGFAELELRGVPVSEWIGERGAALALDVAAGATFSTSRG